MNKKNDWLQIRLAQKKGDFKKMAALLLPLVEMGDAQAQYDLAELYENGNGVRRSIKKAFSWYENAALQKHILAQYRMGEFYEYYDIKPVGINLNEAAQWYKLAAMQGYAKAQYRLGTFYAAGDGVEENAIEAAKWYQKAAAQGLAQAQYCLGKAYYRGYGVPRDYTVGMQWLAKAAMQDNDDAQRYLAEIFLRGTDTPRDYGKSFAFYKMLAGKDKIIEMHYLGMFYEFGKGVIQSNRLARYWYKKALALAQGNRSLSLLVQHSLERLALREKGIVLYVRFFAESSPQREENNTASYLFTNGFYLADMPPGYLGMISPMLPRVDAVFPQLRMEKNLPAWQQAFVAHQAGDRLAAFAQIRELAEGGDMDAWYLLALMYMDGVMMAERHRQAEAALWQVQGGKQALLARWYGVQMCYWHETAREPLRPLRNHSMTRHLLEKLAAEGYPPAQNFLGCLFRQMTWNDGFLIKDELADYWFARAAAQGDAMGQFNFALACERGKYGTRDWAQALAFYTKSAMQGFVPAQIRLGWLCLRGQGVAQDAQMAGVWFMRAADTDDAEAINALGLWLVHKGDAELARKCFAQAAAQGLAVALNNLGVLAPDAATQHDCFTRAAAQGVLQAQANLYLLAERAGDTAQAQQIYEQLVLSGGRAAQRMFSGLVAKAGLGEQADSL